MLIHVIPREGLKVPDPAFVTTPPLRHLPPEGRTVEDDGYWQRRVRDGDVTLGETQADPAHD